ncbi:MAG: hypothetical protein ACLFQM_04060 [Fidelibacterota bacterium]
MNRFKWIILIISIVLMAGILVNCDFNKISNPADDLEIRVKNIARETFVSVEIIDAKTKEQVSVPVEVEIRGDDMGLVINEVNEPTTFFTVENGILLFAIADGIVPTQENPIKLNILLLADNYINTSQPVLVSDTGMNTFSATMTNVNNTPDGVSHNQENVGNVDANDGMPQATEVQSGADNVDGGGAGIKIEGGTKLKDADGNALSGSVEVAVTYFNPKSEDSRSAFPGGFSVELDNGDAGYFETAGFVAVDMTVNGTEVEQFDGNVEIDIDIPEGTMNPVTGQPVKAGDVVPIYSYDEDNGIWHYEGDVTVPGGDGISKSAGGHTVTIDNVKHLSYWNLDWFGDNSCYYGATLNFVSTNGAFDQVLVRIYDAATGEMVTWWSAANVYSSDPSMHLYQVPGNKPVIVKVFSQYTEEEIGSLQIDDLCTDEEYTVEFADISLITVTVNVQVKCDGTAVIPNGIPIYAMKYDSWSWQNLGQVGNGEVSGTFVPNEYYDFAFLFDGEWHYTKNYADDIVKYAQENGINMVKNSDGYLQMDENNLDISIFFNDVDEICESF